MKTRGSLAALVGCTLAVAVLCTLSVEGGWRIWIPIVPAFLVVAVLARKANP